MTKRFILIPILTLSASIAAKSADFSFLVDTSSYWGGGNHTLELYDSYGELVPAYAWADLYDLVDSDGDSGFNYARFQVNVTGVPEGLYSLHLSGSDSGGSFSRWTNLINLTTDINNTEIFLEAFPQEEAPNVPASDLVVSGNLDVNGNVLNFGSEPSMEPGAQFRYLPWQGRLDMAMLSGLGPLNQQFSAFTWSFITDNPEKSPSMRLDYSSRLELFDYYGNAKIILDPAGLSGSTPASILISGSPVLTQAAADSLYARQSPTNLSISAGLRLGASTLSGIGSLSGGSGAKVYGNNSFSFGSGATVGATSASAHNAVALGANSLATKEGAMAFGKNAMATEKQSVAIGQDAEASGGTSFWYDWNYDWGSVAVGTKSKAKGVVSSAFGIGTETWGDVSLAMGWQARTFPGATGAIAIGAGATGYAPFTVAVGNDTHAGAEHSVILGNNAFTYATHSASIGAYVETRSLGQVVVGVAPDLDNGSLFNWDDMDAEVFVVGAGKPGPFVGDPNGGMAQWQLTKRTALSVRRSGELTATGTVNSDAPAQTNEGVKLYNKFKAPILIPASGDISMGEFDAGPQP